MIPPVSTGGCFFVFLCVSFRNFPALEGCVGSVLMIPHDLNIGWFVKLTVFCEEISLIVRQSIMNRYTGR